jgi:uncharacterized protein (TIGR00290 family)
VANESLAICVWAGHPLSLDHWFDHRTIELTGPTAQKLKWIRIALVATPVVFSWSAGKDSAFGLWTVLQNPDFEVRALLTTLTEGYDRVSMSGVREELLDEQAKELGLPLLKVWIPPTCTNAIYEERMAEAFATEPLRSVLSFAFADLFLEDVRTYREERLAQAGKEGIFPLWGRDTAVLAGQMIAAGIRATVVCVDPRALAASFAGRAFDERFLEDLPDGVDPCGERGEFHTFVWDAPMYRKPIGCRTGEVVTRDGFVFCDVITADRDHDQTGIVRSVRADGSQIIPGLRWQG